MDAAGVDMGPDVPRKRAQVGVHAGAGLVGVPRLGQHHSRVAGVGRVVFMVELGERVGDLYGFHRHIASGQHPRELEHPVARHPVVCPVLEVGLSAAQPAGEVERRRRVAAQGVKRRIDPIDGLLEPAEQLERQAVGRLVERVGGLHDRVPAVVVAGIRALQTRGRQLSGLPGVRRAHRGQLVRELGGKAEAPPVARRTRRLALGDRLEPHG